MMIRPAFYYMQQFRALFALMSNTEDWRSELDTSEEGIFGSFFALPLSICFVVIEYFCVRILLLSSAPQATIEQIEILPQAAGAIVNGLSIVISWIIALLALAHIAKRATKNHEFGYLLPAFNWASLLVYGGRSIIFVLLYVLYRTGFSPSVDLIVTLIMIALGFSIFLFWRIFREALGLSARQAVGAFIVICLIDVVTQLCLGSLALAVT